MLNSGTYVFVAKKEILNSDFAKLEKDISDALKRVGALTDVQKNCT